MLGGSGPCASLIPGSEIEKIRLWDKHPRSFLDYKYLNSSLDPDPGLFYPGSGMEKSGSRIEISGSAALVQSLAATKIWFS